jgi:hypothetical protein
MKLQDVAVGQEFIHEGKTYQKIQMEKISCCKFFNALNKETNQKTGIKPHLQVELVNDQQ